MYQLKSQVVSSHFSFCHAAPCLWIFIPHLKHQWVLGKPAGREMLFIKQSYSMPTHWHLSLCISRSFFLSCIMNMHAVGSVPPERKGTCARGCVCVYVWSCMHWSICVYLWRSWLLEMDVSEKICFCFLFYGTCVCVQEQTLLCFMTNWVHQRTDIIMFCEIFINKHCEYTMCVHNMYANTLL